MPENLLRTQSAITASSASACLTYLLRCAPQRNPGASPRRFSLRSLFALPHKQRYVYALTPTGIARKSAMPGRFLKRKQADYEHLKMQIAMLERELPQRDVGQS